MILIRLFKHFGYSVGGRGFCSERVEKQLLYLDIMPLGSRENHSLRISERSGKGRKQLAAVRELLKAALPVGCGKTDSYSAIALRGRG